MMFRDSDSDHSSQRSSPPNGSPLTTMSVLEEGFVPLKRKNTEPAVLTRADVGMKRAMSFSATTGEKAGVGDEQSIWESATWTQLERSKGKLMDRSSSFVLTSGTRSRSQSQVQSPRKLSSPSKKKTGSLEASFGYHPLYADSLSSLNIDFKDPSKPGVIVVVDPFSTGAHLAAEVTKAGLKCARVFSIWDSPVAAMVQQGIEVEYCATVQHKDNNPNQDQAIDETVANLHALPFQIIAVVAGAETGVELADSLSHRMGLRSNGEQGSLARRNKYLMGEKVRDAGVRAVLQRSCVSLEDLREFLQTLPQNPFKCVVKPTQSAGTDCVFLCSSHEEAETAFVRIFGKVNGLGLINESALAQEFLEGKEYVIDKVSCNGVHKAVAIWEYDKRPVNDANFVYFGMRLRPSHTEKAKALMEYADKCLDALGILEGPSHMEVMWCQTGPCLVEVGSRCQGGEGTWVPVAKECVGYTQVELTLDAYLGGKGIFKDIHPSDFPMYKYGRDVDMVNRHGGIVRALVGEKKIRALESFRGLSWEVKPGDYAPKTIDCFTRPGCVQLVHESEEQADADLEAMHALEEFSLIDYSVICPRPPPLGAVVIVDAFSTGSNAAAMLSDWGYKLVLVFSEKDAKVKSLVSKGTNLESTLVITHDNTALNQEAAIASTLKEISACESPILAIIPGTETGIELADILSSRFQTRTNNEASSRQRRDKYLLQEKVRSSGLRAVTQKLCYSEAEVVEFVGSLNGSSSSVVKPNYGAGSDNVYKCANATEAVKAFNSIHGQRSPLGDLNSGALVQELLSGPEFVLDGVSRDGEYKVTAIWRYDKNSINGADFLYQGMHLCDGNGLKESEMIRYARKVNTAVGIVQGPSHMQLIYDSKGPCLVGVGARLHGGEGTWLPVAKECVGYTQVEACLNCYLRPDQYDELPLFPTLKKRGAESFLMAHADMVGKDGATLRSIPGVDNIAELASFRRMELLTQPGALLVPTVNSFTRPGSVCLVNDSPAQLQADYERIRALEQEGLFAF